MDKYIPDECTLKEVFNTMIKIMHCYGENNIITLTEEH